MKLIIAGSRHLDFRPFTGIISNMLVPFGLSKFGNNENDEVVCGGAKGVDSLGEMFANENVIAVKKFDAEWDKYQGLAGPIRNNKMAVYSDALFLIWDGESSGSLHMKNVMIKLGKPVYEVIIRSHNEKK